MNAANLNRGSSLFYPFSIHFRIRSKYKINRHIVGRECTESGDRVNVYSNDCSSKNKFRDRLLSKNEKLEIRKGTNEDVEERVNPSWSL